MARFTRHVSGRDEKADAGERLRIETESLLSYGRKFNCLIDSDLWDDIVTEHQFKFIGGGAEHHVYEFPLTDSVAKVTIPPYFGNPLLPSEYCKSLLLSNFIFGDDVSLKGILHRDGTTSILTKQRFIKGTCPSYSEISHWMTAQGYEDAGFNRWKHTLTKVIIEDVHIGNVIKTISNFLFPIDVQVKDPHNYFNILELGDEN